MVLTRHMWNLYIRTVQVLIVSRNLSVATGCHGSLSEGYIVDSIHAYMPINFPTQGATPPVKYWISL